MRDGVTGNTSGFELEDEGSTPSPAANLSNANSKGTSIDSMKNKEDVEIELMFIRFVGAEIDERSHVSAGLFCAASQLRRSEGLPDFEFDALTELKDWFDVHMQSPFDHLPRERRYEQAICWFKPTAREHLERAWDLVAILERNDVLIWTIKAPRTGYVHYEDEVQVFARPYDDVRLRL